MIENGRQPEPQGKRDDSAAIDTSPVSIAVMLKQAGLAVQADALRLEHRGDRMLVRADEDWLAWFPLASQAAAEIRVENRLLALLAGRLSLQTPRPLFASPEGWTVRSMVPGRVDASGLAARLKAEPALRRQAAWALGRILAELHGVDAAKVADWLPPEPAWPMSMEQLRGQLPEVVGGDPILIARIERALMDYDASVVASSDRVLVHADLGLHNVAFDEKTGTINGVFDFGSAAWADRHLDLRYLVFAAIPDALLDETMAAYREASGTVLSRSRVLLCNAVAAASHLAFRAGYGPDDVVAGRTLQQDIVWTNWSMGRAGF